MRFGRAARVRRRGEFLAVQDHGRRLYSAQVVVLALEKKSGTARIGITVSSRVANAVGRNRVKRWVREAFRRVAKELPPVDLVVIARPAAAQMGFEGARKALEAARDRLSAGAGRA